MNTSFMFDINYIFGFMCFTIQSVHIKNNVGSSKIFNCDKCS